MNAFSLSTLAGRLNFGLALAVFALTLLAVPAQAQNTVSGTVDAQMEVVQGVSFVNDADVDFGRVPSGVGNVTLSPTTGDINQGDGATTVGVFRVSGTADESVSIQFSSSTDLNANSGSSLNFQPAVATSDNDTQGTATEYTSGTAVTLDADGERFFYIGGDVDVPTGQGSGTYQGSLTFDVSYTSL